MGPWYEKSSALHASERYCTCCGRELSAAFRYLELDQRTQTYHDCNDVPADKSQGWFPFGLTCAKKLVKAEVKRRSDDAHASRTALATARYGT